MISMHRYRILSGLGNCADAIKEHSLRMAGTDYALGHELSAGIDPESWPTKTS